MSVGTTRVSGNAGAMIDLAMFLAGDLTELKGPIKIATPKWIYGTGAGAVNVIYADTITLADGANTTLDLYASGSLLDIFKQDLTMTALKFLFLRNNSEDATLLAFGGLANDITVLTGMTTENVVLNIKPGGHICWSDPSDAGLVITTNKNLKLEHDGSGSSSMDVDVVAMGLD